MSVTGPPASEASESKNLRVSDPHCYSSAADPSLDRGAPESGASESNASWRGPRIPSLHVDLLPEVLSAARAEVTRHLFSSVVERNEAGETGVVWGETVCLCARARGCVCVDRAEV
eukprot:g3153.t1